MTQSESPEREAEMLGMQDAPTIYADGMVQLAFGYPNSKLIFGHSIGVTNGQEDSKVQAILVMPTASMLQMCNIIMSNAQDSIEELRIRQKQGQVQIEEQFAALSSGGASESPKP